MVFVFGSFVVCGRARAEAHRPRPRRRRAIDATIVRVVLVPATMELLGDANWWLPRWLDRILPRVRIEEATTDVEVPPEPEQELVGASR